MSGTCSRNSKMNDLPHLHSTGYLPVFEVYRQIAKLFRWLAKFSVFSIRLHQSDKAIFSNLANPKFY